MNKWTHVVILWAKRQSWIHFERFHRNVCQHVICHLVITVILTRCECDSTVIILATFKYEDKNILKRFKCSKSISQESSTGQFVLWCVISSPDSHYCMPSHYIFTFSVKVSLNKINEGFFLSYQITLKE